MRRTTPLLLALTGVVAFLLGLVFSGTRSPGDARSDVAHPSQSDPSPLRVSTAPAAAGGAGVGIDFSVVAARLNGAVVNIDAASRGVERPAGTPRRFSRDGGDDPSAPREGSGSGFIID